MYAETCFLQDGLGQKKTKLKPCRWGIGLNPVPENGFWCKHCGAFVHTLPALSGVQNRNHCPYCLWSRHLDHLQAGDRMSACKALMRPIGLTIKPSHNKYASPCAGELMVIHQCSDCGKLSINRIAADDLAEVVAAVFRASLELDKALRHQLDLAGIKPLLQGDEILVNIQLNGMFNME